MTSSFPSTLSRFALLIAVLGGPGTKLLAAQTDAQSPSDVVLEAWTRHAAELVIIANAFRSERLFNDGENLLLEADRWVRSDGWRTTIARQRERLVANKKEFWEDGRREEYRRFVESTRYDSTRKRLMAKRAEVEKESARVALEAAEKALAEQRVLDAEQLLDFVSRVDATVARGLRGREARGLWKEVRARHAGAGLARLEFGETTSRLPVTLEELRGKVVLWRSKSL